MNHITDVYEWEGNIYVHRCDLSGEEREKKKWIKNRKELIIIVIFKKWTDGYRKNAAKKGNQIKFRV